MKTSLTIGIPIRNEEESLPTFVESLRKSLHRLNIEFPSLQIELFFCLNGTTDKSEEILCSILLNDFFKNTRIIHSKPGKINAILKIVENRKLLEGYICFIDADVELDEFCIVNLFKNLQSNDGVFLSYSSVFPKQNQNKSFVQKIQSIHYLLRHSISPRKYFHGRAYMMRSSVFLEQSPKKSLSSYWNLNDGPYVDDIYLSRLIVHAYGLGSIKESDDSILWFLSPKSLKDFYFGQRRLLFEIKRLNLLYPEHNYVQSMFFKKKISWSYFLNMNIKYLFLYFPYYFLEESIRFAVRFEMIMISLRIIKCKTIWKPLKTTKKWKR